MRKYPTEEERKAALRENQRRYRASGRRSLEKEREYAARARAKPEIREKRRLAALTAHFASYGFTEEDYNALLVSQNGGCAICARPPTNRRLDIDHEHTKGYKGMPGKEKRMYVRGLLCHRCNRALGLFGNDANVLLKAGQNLVRYAFLYIQRKP